MDDEPKAASVVPTTSIDNPPDPSIKLPPIVRSGALNNNGGLEYDQQGIPYYKFPPFVTTTLATSATPAAPLVSFSAFVPNGLHALDDLQQVDGLGIPTVQLEVKHEPGGKDAAKKKKKYKKKPLDVTFEKRVMWWEDWENSESSRRADPPETNAPRVERFARCAADFQKNRKWTPTLQSVYDNFTQYVGLSGKTYQLFGKGFASAKRQAKELEEDFMDDEDDDEAEFVKALQTDSITNPPAPNSQDARIQELTSEYDAELERRELKSQAFLDDPESRMKIFFSSFYKNKGLFWSESKLRDGPLLLRFFFQFFIRNRLMRDYDRAFHKALAVIEKAAVELPLTTKISKNIPDELGNGCVAVWGKQMVEIVEKERKKMLESRQAEKETMTEPEESPFDPTAPSEDVNMSTDTNTNPTGWGTDPFNTLSKTSADPSAWTPFEIPKQWDPTADANPPDADPWSTNPNPNPNSNPNSDWELPPPPFLMSLFGGPIAFPATHEVKLVEKSTRKVHSVDFADDNFPEIKSTNKRRSLFSSFGKVTLAPWRDAKQKEGETEGSILPPELHVINSSPASNDDPTNRNISVYMSPSACTMLRDAIGMGLYAVFVKVGLVDSPKAAKQEEESPPPSASKKRKSKVSSTSNLEDPDSEFWYIEFLYEVAPSFWTESDEGFEEGSDSF